MKQKIKKLSPSAIAFLVLMSKVKQETPLEIMREFNEEAHKRKTLAQTKNRDDTFSESK